MMFSRKPLPIYDTIYDFHKIRTQYLFILFQLYVMYRFLI